MRKTIWLIVLCALTADAQQQPFTVKVDTQLVIETVAVKDSAGKPIEGLTEKDFNITEDGVRQTISVLDFQRLNNAPLPALQPQSILQMDKADVPTVTPTVISAARGGEIKYQD